MRRKQCKKCPWKVSTDPNEIPGGYSAEKHRKLRSTIGQPLGESLRQMACHETPVGREQACVGWLANQLGPGNSIAVRWAVRRGLIDINVELDGPQHDTFEQTLPSRMRCDVGEPMENDG